VAGGPKVRIVKLSAVAWAMVVKRSAVVPGAVTMARPTVCPVMVTVVKASGSLAMAGIGRMATLPTSRMATTARSPLGERVRSVAAAGKVTVVRLPSLSATIVMVACASRRTSP
jgi:hypothetical protein